jgi:hypothetical protein
MVQRSLVALVALLALAPSCAQSTTWSKRVIADPVKPDPVLASAADGSAVLAWEPAAHGRSSVHWLAIDPQGRPGPERPLVTPADHNASILDLDVSPAGAAILCTLSDLNPDVIDVAMRRPGGDFGPATQVAVMPDLMLVSASCAIDDAGDAVVAWTEGLDTRRSNYIGAVRAVRVAADGAVAPVQTIRAKAAILGDVAVGAGGRAFLTLSGGADPYHPLISIAEPGARFDVGFRAPSAPFLLGPGASAGTAGLLVAWRHGTAVHLGRVRPRGVSDVAHFREREPRLTAGPDIVADSAGHGLLTWDAPASRTDVRKSVGCNSVAWVSRARRPGYCGAMARAVRWSR